ncbi:hypothetical protein CHLRE_03g196300v5 [Chlamydomonas reinhardtii]|uniref:Radical SAM core domain-containing protein n=1 Tax=Chlamydomonas reinhardtii TaxID=3055 RepID=A0A2K3DYR6_CHLRE|nr:uncharacterized protein CHLRE_03g196300v5 [Chlamydomonas reinhardtii]PNW85647.1 hypothetical protein CHLRE_03g196300v5 [Chlamydomonas reinhardtii]
MLTSFQAGSGSLACQAPRRLPSPPQTAAVLHQQYCRSAQLALPPTVNWHLEPRCNYHCKFCFATFSDIPSSEVVKDADLLLAVPPLLAAAGVSKITFVGGEPLLHPLLPELLAAAKGAGLVTSLVSNGSLLTEDWLRRMQGHLDWIAFSVDASDDALHAALGRGTTRETGVTMPRHSSSSSSSTKNSSHRKPSGDGSSRGGATGSGTATSPAVGRGGGGGDVGGGVGTRGGHLARVERLWGVAQGLGYRLKLNTVVTAPCLGDVGGMVELVGRLRPERWKVFQVLPITGQTQPEHIAPLLTTEAQFADWVAAASVVQELYGVPLVPESNSHMHGSYAMLDARGRFYQDVNGEGYEYGPSIFDCWQGRLLESLALDSHAHPHQPRLAAAPSHDAAVGTSADDVHAAAMAVLMARPTSSPAAVGSGGVARGAAAGDGDGDGGNSNGAGPNARTQMQMEAGREAVMDAWGAVAGPAFRAEAFATRGGVYEWGQGGEALEEQQRAWGEAASSSGGAESDI